MDAMVAALAQSGVPQSFWVKALGSFIHVWNRLPSSSTALKSSQTTPYELWYHKKPDLAHLRVWGCRAYAHVQKDKRNKLGWHMLPCVFIGYPSDYQGWKCWDPVSKKSVISERVEFDERYFPLSKLAKGAPSITPTPPTQFQPEDLLSQVPVLPDEGEDAPERPFVLPEVRPIRPTFPTPQVRRQGPLPPQSPSMKEESPHQQIPGTLTS